MRDYEPEWGDEADVPRIARAMAMENRKGNAPLYLDMSAIPEAPARVFHPEQGANGWTISSASSATKRSTDMFGKTPYYALNQMTKMGIRTGSDCRSDVPGLLSAGLAQSGCANHFAGFHIGLCVGNGWIAGRSGDRGPRPPAGARARCQAEVRALHRATCAPLDPDAEGEVGPHAARAAGA